MVGEGCDDRISDVPKSGGVCNADVIGQGGGGGMIGKVSGKLPRHDNVYGPLLLTLFYTRL